MFIAHAGYDFCTPLGVPCCKHYFDRRILEHIRPTRCFRFELAPVWVSDTCVAVL